MIGTFGFILHTFGEIMVAFTAIMVHHRFWKEHRVDDLVFEEMRRERQVGIVGIVLITLGFILQLVDAFYFKGVVY